MSGTGLVLGVLSWWVIVRLRIYLGVFVMGEVVRLPCK